MEITVTNRQRKESVDIRFLRRVAERALPLCAGAPGANPAVLAGLSLVEVSILSDAAITRINEQFLSHEGPTDVVTFEHGEILVSAETARKNGLRFGNPLNREIALCIIHGLLHLNGWNDNTAGEAGSMNEMQQRILSHMPS